MKTDVRHLVARPNADGSCRWYWQPSATLKALGFASRALGRTPAGAWAPGRPVPHELAARAETWNAEADRARDDRHVVRPDGPPTVSAIFALYRASRAFTERRPATQVTYRDTMKRLEEWAGDVPALALDHDRVERFYLARRAMAPAYAAAIMRTGRLVFAWAVAKGHVPSNPFQHQKVSRGTRKQGIWSPEEVRHLAAVADAMGAFSIGTAVLLDEWFGQRREEVIALDWRQVDADGITIERQSKTGGSCYLSLPEYPHLVARLEEERARGRARQVVATAVVVDERTGRRYDRHAFTHRFEEVRAAAVAAWRAAGRDDDADALATRQFRQLRHTAVTRMGERGVDLQSMCAVTGHSFQQAQRILDVYMVRTRDMARKAARISQARREAEGGKDG